VETLWEPRFDSGWESLEESIEDAAALFISRVPPSSILWLGEVLDPLRGIQRGVGGNYGRWGAYSRGGHRYRVSSSRQTWTSKRTRSIWEAPIRSFFPVVPGFLMPPEPRPQNPPSGAARAFSATPLFTLTMCSFTRAPQRWHSSDTCLTFSRQSPETAPTMPRAPWSK